MKNLEMQTERIMNYLYDDLETQQKWNFEQDLNSDKALFQEFQLHLEIDQTIKKESQVNKFRDTLEQIHLEQFNRPRRNKIINIQNKWYWAAASITVFSGSAVYTLSKQSQSADKLYRKYYEVWQPGFATRSQTTNNELGQITSHFENGNYTEALSLIDNLTGTAPLNPQTILIKGCSLMEIGMFTDAITVFKLFDNEDYTLYTETAQWYKALCYLKVDDTMQAYTTLQAITNNMGAYADDAQTILKKMK